MPSCALRSSCACCLSRASSSSRLRWRRADRRWRWRAYSSSSDRASQLPAGFGQGHRLPELVANGRVLPLHQRAAFVQRLLPCIAQRLQRLAAVLLGAVHLLLRARIHRLEGAVAPGRIAGQKHDAIGIAGQHNVGVLDPLALQLQQHDLDRDQPQHLVFAAAIAADGTREKVTGLAGGHTNAVEAALVMGQRQLHIGAKAVVLTHVAGGTAPVAGGNGNALGIDQGQGRGQAGAIGLFELVVQALHLLGALRRSQRLAQLGIERQHIGQHPVAVNALVKGLRIQADLAVGKHTFFGEAVLQHSVPCP